MEEAGEAEAVAMAGMAVMVDLLPVNPVNPAVLDMAEVEETGAQAEVVLDNQVVPEAMDSTPMRVDTVEMAEAEDGLVNRANPANREGLGRAQGPRRRLRGVVGQGIPALQVALELPALLVVFKTAVVLKVSC